MLALSEKQKLLFLRLCSVITITFFSALRTLLVDEWRLQAPSKTEQSFSFVTCSAFCNFSFSKDVFRQPGKKIFRK